MPEVLSKIEDIVNSKDDKSYKKSKFAAFYYLLYFEYNTRFQNYDHYQIEDFIKKDLTNE